MWRALLSIPLACTDGPTLDTVGMVDAFEVLHSRIYGVYDLDLDRDEVHDLLAQSFVGTALTREYVAHWTRLVHLAGSDTAIRILRIDHDDITVIHHSAAGARIEAAWSVGGIVVHGDHEHQRLNRYRAVYDVEQTPSGWRIVDSQLRDLRRVAHEDADVFDLIDQAGGGFLDPLDLFDADAP